MNMQERHIPLPLVTSMSVDHGNNHPVGRPNSADGEVDLDIEIAGAIAPGAHIVVYFAPNTDQGFLDAITQATHDTRYNPSVISISWGGPEVNWTAQAMQLMDQAFQVAVALGITVCCAAGDNGSGDGVTDGKAHVDFPASSPYVLGCGGTRLESANNQVTSEVVWNDAPDSSTGGGVSDVFGPPAWQANAGIPSSINVNPILYQNYIRLVQANALRDVTVGNNGGYFAGQGWDACTGVGTPNGAKLLGVLP